MRVLLSWLGLAELEALEGNRPDGPLACALKAQQQRFDRVVLLSDHHPDRGSAFVRAFPRHAINLMNMPLANPVDYREVHNACVQAIEQTYREHQPKELLFFLNSGTPPMGATWMLLGKSRFPARLVAWGRRSQSIEDIEVPFEISAQLVLETTSKALRESTAEPPPDLAFQEIIHESEVMKELIARARRVAAHTVPVILEGESGTGKELFARAIHKASPRREGPFVAVNCGAIPPDLIESELFGHIKGAFSGAIENREGHFKAADGGTLFLDEIGELPLPMQVKLLRPLQEQKIVPVGSSEDRGVDVRVIAATNRNLIDDVRTGRFREDLFYRLAVAVLRVPSLRDRPEDLEPLARHFITSVNKQNLAAGLKATKRLMPDGNAALKGYSWPGNVRELINTLRRAVVWSDADLHEKEIRDAFLSAGARQSGGVLDRPFVDRFDLQSVVDEVERHYIERALRVSGNKKVAAARLLGFASHQVLSNHMKRLRLAGPDEAE